MFKVNNRNARTSCEICSSASAPCSSVSVVNFEKINPDWVKENIDILPMETLFFPSFCFFLSKKQGKEKFF